MIGSKSSQHKGNESEMLIEEQTFVCDLNIQAVPANSCSRNGNKSLLNYCNISLKLFNNELCKDNTNIELNISLAPRYVCAS